MALHTELCTFRTADKQRLHGLLFTPGGTASGLGLIMVHGVAMNFYLPPLPTIGQALAQNGFHSFVINTRGHDWVCRAGNLTQFGGAAYETFEESLLDLDAAIQFMSGKGYERFVLVGHSLGCVKSLLYQGTRQRRDVVGVVSCSCPKQFYSARAEEQPEFIGLMEKAERLIDQGKAEQFLWAPASGGTGLFTARTFENKYGRHEKNDVRPHAARLGCPHLAIAGSAEHPYFPEYAEALAQAGGPSASYKIVADANHFYSNRESVVVDTLMEWLEALVR